MCGVLLVQGTPEAWKPPAHEVGWLFIPQNAELRELAFIKASAVPVLEIGNLLGISRISVAVSLRESPRQQKYVVKCFTHCSGETSATHMIFHRLAHKLMS